MSNEYNLFFKTQTPEWEIVVVCRRFYTVFVVFDLRWIMYSSKIVYFQVDWFTGRIMIER